jgi:predicted N-acetyltransferase YhbS
MDIRNATENDLKDIARVEKECFSAAEAASEKQFSERLAVYPDHFWLLYDNDRLVAVVNGLVTDEKKLRDEMFADVSFHNERGKWQMLFGVETVPEYRGRGCAGLLIRRGHGRRKKTGQNGDCSDLQGKPDFFLRKIRVPGRRHFRVRSRRRDMARHAPPVLDSSVGTQDGRTADAAVIVHFFRIGKGGIMSAGTGKQQVFHFSVFSCDVHDKFIRAAGYFV